MSQNRFFPKRGLFRINQFCLSLIKVFFAPKGACFKLPRRPEECLKKQFLKKKKKASQGSWALEARKSSSCLTAAGLPRRVSRPAICGAGSASFSRVSRPSVLKAPASSTAFTRRSVRSLLRWNLALSCRTLNSVAGCFSTSSGAPCTVSSARCRPRPPAQSGRSTARPCAPPGPSSASG